MLRGRDHVQLRLARRCDRVDCVILLHGNLLVRESVRDGLEWEVLSQQQTLSHHSPDGWEAALACSNASGHAMVVCDLLRRVVKPDVGIRIAETETIRRCKLYCSVEQLPAVNGIHCWWFVEGVGRYRTVYTRQSKAKQATTCYVCDALGATTMEAIRYVTGGTRANLECPLQSGLPCCGRRPL